MKPRCMIVYDLELDLNWIQMEAENSMNHMLDLIVHGY